MPSPSTATRCMYAYATLGGRGARGVDVRIQEGGLHSCGRPKLHHGQDTSSGRRRFVRRLQDDLSTRKPSFSTRWMLRTAATRSAKRGWPVALASMKLGLGIGLVATLVIHYGCDKILRVWVFFWVRR